LDFNPPLAPGETSIKFDYTRAGADSSYVCSGFIIDTVEPVGRGPFTPTDGAEWLAAKEQLDNLKPYVSTRLNEFMGWLRNIR
jgi:hypothetical protein